MVVFVQMSRIMSGSCAFVTRCRAHVIGLFIHFLPYPSICVTVSALSVSPPSCGFKYVISAEQ